MNVLEILLGQIPEAIYFSLFMIFAKNLKTKRFLLIILMILEYLLLKQFLSFTIWFQVLYTFLTFVILKILYREKAQITDIFTFAIGSILLMIISLISLFLVYNIIKNVIVVSIINRFLLFIVLFLLNKHLYKIQDLYKKFWNRNDKIKKKMKTVTFRCINLVVFNLIFYIISVGMIYCILLRK